MQTDCCYATQDKTWVHDPDGNEWEAFVVLKDNLPEAPRAANTACCSTTGRRVRRGDRLILAGPLRRTDIAAYGHF